MHLISSDIVAFFRQINNIFCLNSKKYVFNIDEIKISSAIVLFSNSKLCKFVLFPIVSVIAEKKKENRVVAISLPSSFFILFYAATKTNENVQDNKWMSTNARRMNFRSSSSSSSVFLLLSYGFVCDFVVWLHYFVFFTLLLNIFCFGACIQNGK